MGVNEPLVERINIRWERGCWGRTPFISFGRERPASSSLVRKILDVGQKDKRNQNATELLVLAEVIREPSLIIIILIKL